MVANPEDGLNNLNMLTSQICYLFKKPSFKTLTLTFIIGLSFKTLGMAGGR